MKKRDRFSRVTQRRIRPTDSMKQFLGGSAFGTVLAAAVLFAFLHQRVISAELEQGTGGIWCVLGTPAALCLVISAALCFFSSKTRLLPALVPIIGLGGIEASLVMFAVIQIRRLGVDGGMLGMVQEISILAFLAAMFLCVLMLMFTGVGMIVPSFIAVPATITAIVALVLFVIRVMYNFGLTFTAIGYNLVIPNGGMETEIAWILRSVTPGTEECVSVYYARLVDCIATALLLLTCVTLTTTFRGFFAEQAYMIKNARDIPLPVQQRVVYTGYEEYTEDTARPAEESFELTRDGYYVEKKEVPRAKFKRHEHGERTEEPETEEIEQPREILYENEDGELEVYVQEYYDDYIPGEGWELFRARTGYTDPSVQEDGERKKVTPRQAEPPAPDPRDPELWNRYKK